MNLVPVNHDDRHHLSVLYQLLALREHKVNISHRSMPSFDDHAAFVRSLPYMAWYLINAGEDFVYTEGRMSYEIAGSVYLTRKREIGIFLLPNYQGKGIAYKAVTALMEKHPGKFYANIAPANTRSQEFFQRLGFGLIQHTYEFQPGEQDATNSST